MKPDAKTGDALARDASDIAATAAADLLNDNEDRRQLYGEDADIMWRDHFRERILELSSAITLGQPSLFSARVVWSKTAMLARGANPDDVDAGLKSLGSAIRQQMPVEIAKTADEYLDHGKRSREGISPDLSKSLLDPGLSLDRLALQYLQCAMSGNVLQAIEVVIDGMDNGISVQDLFRRVLLPAQAEIGRLWHINEASVAEEHLVSNTTQRLMAVLASRAPRRADRGKTLIAAAVSGNAHDMGIRAISYYFEFDGWRTIYLGADTPKSEILSSLSVYQADLILLSAGLTTQLSTLKRTIDGIRQINAGIPILVGGNAFSQSPDLWKDIGADGSSTDLDRSLELALELTKS